MTMRRFAPLLAAGLLLAVAGCTNPFSTTQTSSTAAPEEAPEVKAAIDQFVAKYNAHDADGVSEFYADDTNFRWIEDGRVVYEGRTAAVTGLTNFFAGFGDSRLEAYDVKVSMLTDESAVASFKFSQVVAANGQASLKFEGTMSLALSDRDGGWKIVVGHKSSNGAPR
ncbi:MAG: SnoaL-like domain-containing protein [Alphaproteobacteria bacterium]|nr:SnoaL-like domain-containing protein [Alphaproteobacteria bacterium]